MKKIIKPEVTNSNVVHENDYFSVRKDQLLLRKMDDGKLETLEKEYFVIDGHDFVVVIAVKDSNILLINQYRYAINQFSNEFVAGIIEKDQEPREAAKKELLEEAGIKVNKLYPVGKIYSMVGKGSFCGHIFVTDDFEIDEPELEEYESFVDLTQKWVSVKEFKKMMFDGKIKDSVTLASWALLMGSSKN